jgi:predicted nucleotidyltransferase/DNA-binding transcriptional regulator YiaG
MTKGTPTAKTRGAVEQPIDNPLYARDMGVPTNSPGSLLRDARRRANLSQTDVARRAGVAQSVISAYESGRREPAFSTLMRLIAATGHRVEVELSPDNDACPGLPNTPLGRRLRQRRRKVLATAAKHGASNVRVFGSVARGEDTSHSDIDLLVDLSPRSGLVALGRLERELSQVLGTSVDVVPADSLRPHVRTETDREAIQL